MPLAVRDKVCDLLNGNYGPVPKGCFDFAIEMGIAETQARCLDDAKHVIDILITMCVSVYGVIIGLDKMKRLDAMNVLVEWMQVNPN